MLRLAQLAHCPERLRVSRLAICYVKAEFTARLSLQFRRSECSISDALNAARPFPHSYLYLARSESGLVACHISVSAPRRRLALNLAPNYCSWARRSSNLGTRSRTFLRAPSQNGKGSPGSRCAAVIYLCMRLSYVAWFWVSGLYQGAQWHLIPECFLSI